MPSKVVTSLFLGLAFLVFFAQEVNCFSWKPQRFSDGNQVASQHLQRSDGSNQSLRQQQEQRLSNVYTIAIQELQELESEPLCHRNAARLLVNNCHLLDGQDDAKIHIDSGRAARDFVDSYAVSLAICDLERGSFRIPAACSKFRETSLAALPIATVPLLHVSTIEIDGCLEGLAQSDSAWNTWVSYRHKALRFCDAARADHEKDENLQTYQRITKILAKLTHDIDADLGAKAQSIHRAFDAASQSADSIGSQVHHIRTEMDKASKFLRHELRHAVQDSRDIVESSLKDTQALHDLLELLISSVQKQTAEISSSFEVEVHSSTEKLNTEVEIMMAALTAAAGSSVALRNQIQTAELRSDDIMMKLEKIETGVMRLDEHADDLLVKYDSHELRLNQALQKTNQVLDILDTAAASASVLQGYAFGGFGLSRFWPHVFCPVLFLAMGSYRLPPSLGRNLWLIGLGELMGVLVSTTMGYYANLFSSVVPTLESFDTPASNLSQTGVTYHLGDAVKQESQAAEHDRQLQYWKKQLADSAPAKIPTDFARPALLSGKAGVMPGRQKI
ncbi:hypothetical protein FGRMN_8047 [Fusarium graminum]|nr:hypothetical protein FGRMN_8047 [Fusarium graminum]